MDLPSIDIVLTIVCGIAGIGGFFLPLAARYLDTVAVHDLCVNAHKLRIEYHRRLAEMHRRYAEHGEAVEDAGPVIEVGPASELGGGDPAALRPAA